MAKLTKEKVRAMLDNDIIMVSCDNASELDSVYQTACKARSEFSIPNMEISKSNKTMVVVIRTTKQ